MSEQCDCVRPTTRLLEKARQKNQLCTICYRSLTAEEQGEDIAKYLNPSGWNDSGSVCSEYLPNVSGNRSTDSLEYRSDSLENSSESGDSTPPVENADQDRMNNQFAGQLADALKGAIGDESKFKASFRGGTNENIISFFKKSDLYCEKNDKDHDWKIENISLFLDGRAFELSNAFERFPVG